MAISLSAISFLLLGKNQSKTFYLAEPAGAAELKTRKLRKKDISPYLLTNI
jgi:hypothetical protein